MADRQACYEDQTLAHRSFAANFEATHTQPVEEAWSFDLAVPYIRRDYSARAAEDDRASFAREVSARVSLEHANKDKMAYLDGEKCQESRWRGAGDSLAKVCGVSARCCFGQTNTSTLAARCWRWPTPTLFWKGIETVCRKPTCAAKGIYGRATRGSGPVHVQEGRPPGATWICSSNPAISWYSMDIHSLLRKIYAKGPGLLERYANEHAYILPCLRATHLDDAPWFGWEQCTIRLEYHHARAAAGRRPADQDPAAGRPE
ncbi:hypothetical protein DL765_006655 [Monosporascus sp. GIB2]|nr:hypothetical protein DL765_006655 [Monosporascus sp. GIB2]